MNLMQFNEMEPDPTTSIPTFYAGRSIFITGGTGFMGKVLIEKLLRSCPGIGEIFLLMRAKKGTSIDERLSQMLSLPLFDKLRETDASVFKKLIPVTGDVADEGLGLPTIERRVLTEKVSVIFHVAASVRFDDSLKQAVLLNTRGTREVCILAAGMKKLVALLHVSTTYGNTDRPVVDEKLYPPHANWKKTINIAETIDEHTLNSMTAKYLGKLPNTYTFTKQLAEHVINDHAGVVPGVIFRPSVVISSVSEPVSGWLDNFNGPVGLMIGGGKGILRTVYAKPDTLTDFIPVDIAIKAMIACAWKRGIKTITQDPGVPIYNCASSGTKVISTRNLVAMALQLTEEIPFEGILWVPGTSVQTVRWIYSLTFWILQLIPALVIDGVLKLGGTKPMLLKLQRKIYMANFALQYFLVNNWKFLNNNLLAVSTSMSKADAETFGFQMGNFDIRDYFKNSVIGSKLYLLKEDMNKLVEAQAHFNKMWWIDRTLKVWLGVLLTWATIASGLLAFVKNFTLSALDTLFIA
ncbi:putative fatty acyl-CoA reductase CG5065 [Athalia rosae]|uniref:putative fatty acyl-CoA reductase CG5065 n=1 Tax=Athalia rosae TaxID=37344 RepID=UPI002033EBF0|nr:putative fatty acyl-CoA reductase CG5065 [Athalia rosae]